jgi:hypothetical protein
MKRFALCFAFFLMLFNISTSAQDNQTAKSSRDDSSAVQATVREYIEAYYTGDVPRMEQTLHPLSLKHLIHGTIPMREKTAAQTLSDVRAHGSADHSEQLEQISRLDVSGNIASAKLVTQGWVD